jgi:hypothetical protein
MVKISYGSKSRSSTKSSRNRVSLQLLRRLLRGAGVVLRRLTIVVLYEPPCDSPPRYCLVCGHRCRVKSPARSSRLSWAQPDSNNCPKSLVDIQPSGTLRRPCQHFTAKQSSIESDPYIPLAPSISVFSISFFTDSGRRFSLESCESRLLTCNLISASIWALWIRIPSVTMSLQCCLDVSLPSAGYQEVDLFQVLVPGDHLSYQLEHSLSLWAFIQGVHH